MSRSTRICDNLNEYTVNELVYSVQQSPGMDYYKTVNYKPRGKYVNQRRPKASLVRTIRKNFKESPQLKSNFIGYVQFDCQNPEINLVEGPKLPEADYSRTNGFTGQYHASPTADQIALGKKQDCAGRKTRTSCEINRNCHYGNWPTTKCRRRSGVLSGKKFYAPGSPSADGVFLGL